MTGWPAVCAGFVITAMTFAALIVLTREPR